MTRSPNLTAVPASRFIDNSGVKLHILDSGVVTGDTSPPLVFVPGMTDVADDYTAMLTTFDRRVVVVDLRGHGRSDAPSERYAFADHVDDIAAVIDDVTDGPLHLMTFSRGSCYALGWLERHPDRVRSISIGDYPAREIAISPSMHPRLSTGTWRGTPVGGRIDEHSLLRVFEESIDRPLWHVLADPELPTLVVRGDARVPLTDDDWQRYQTDVPHATLVEFDGSPHDIFRPDRTRYPALVRDHVGAADRHLAG